MLRNLDCVKEHVHHPCIGYIYPCMQSVPQQAEFSRTFVIHSFVYVTGFMRYFTGPKRFSIVGFVLVSGYTLIAILIINGTCYKDHCGKILYLLSHDPDTYFMSFIIFPAAILRPE